MTEYPINENIIVDMPNYTDFLFSGINQDDISNFANASFKDYFTLDPDPVNFMGFKKQADLEILFDANNSNQIISRVLIKDCPKYFNSTLFRLSGTRCIDLFKFYKSFQKTDHIKGLSIADNLWLYYLEWMGLFKILLSLIDFYTNRCTFPIKNDNLTTLLIERMTQLFKSGEATNLKDRNSSYRQSLGWITEKEFAMDGGYFRNFDFSKYFHNMITSALSYYKEKKIAENIKASGSATQLYGFTSNKNSISMLITNLKHAGVNFIYNRNYYNTLNGIIWAISTLTVIHGLKNTLGIPYEEEYKLIPATLEKLQIKSGSSSSNFESFLKCADSGRAILLSIEGLPDDPMKSSAEFDTWLEKIETHIELYRTAYNNITGVDLGGKYELELLPQYTGKLN